MIRFVILEGWDEVGKTTLARYLSQALGRGDPSSYPYVHIGAPRPEKLDVDEHHRAVRAERAVIDRAWWSNLIYAPLVENREPMSLETVRWLELAAADCALVRVDCDTETLERRLEHRDEWSDLLPPSKALAHVRSVLTGTRVPRRRRFVYWTGSRPMTWSPWGTVVSRPEDLLAELGLLSEAYPGWRSEGIGNPYLAKAVLVGERHPRGLRPFEASRSGSYLFRALEGLDWTTDDLYVTNAAVPGVADELRFLERNDLPIVALGHDADDLLIQAGIRAAFRRHPQFWSRFQHDRIDEYTKNLGASLGFSLTDP